jgi:RNA polymerase sigma factor (sigma-70 family)
VYARSPLLRFQSDERLVGFVRRGQTAAYETLVARYEQRLFAFCRHLLGSHEDAEDVLQEVLAAAFKAMRADDRPIHVRPWLYRIARNRSLNHLRRGDTGSFEQIEGQWSEHGTTTADKVQQREEFRLLMADIEKLPPAQRTALILREMKALSYEEIALAMDTTVPSVKSLLVRARASLGEAAEARQMTCDQVRNELREHGDQSRRRLSAVVRRHLRSCEPCRAFRSELRRPRRTQTFRHLHSPA